MAHTPGPWHITDLNAVDAPNIVDDAGNEVLGTSEWLRLDEDNARLIAAAPELLEAAEACAKVLAYHGIAPAVFRQVEAAIAKATNNQ